MKICPHSCLCQNLPSRAVERNRHDAPSEPELTIGPPDAEASTLRIAVPSCRFGRSDPALRCRVPRRMSKNDHCYKCQTVTADWFPWDNSKRARERRAGSNAKVFAVPFGENAEASCIGSGAAVRAATGS